MTNLNQNGRSMIEMLGVLAIIGVLSVGGIAGYSKAMMKFKTNKTIDQIAMTVTNIRTLYAQQAYYDITTADAYKMGVVDDAMVVLDTDGKPTSNLTNVFGGSVTIAPAESGAIGEEGPDSTTKQGAFLITFTNLPREACVAIATNDWGSNYSSGLLGVAAGDAISTMNSTCKIGIKTPDGATKYACGSATTAAALSVAEAAAGCNASGNSNSIALKYY